MPDSAGLSGRPRCTRWSRQHVISSILPAPPDFRRRCGWSWRLSPAPRQGRRHVEVVDFLSWREARGLTQGPALLISAGSHPSTGRGDRGPGAEALRRCPWCRDVAANDGAYPLPRLLSGRAGWGDRRRGQRAGVACSRSGRRSIPIDEAVVGTRWGIRPEAPYRPVWGRGSGIDPGRFPTPLQGC